MGRLIDVDVYCNTTCKCNRRECDRSRCPIHNAPTAYDPDKVVEQLKEATFNTDMAGIDDEDIDNNDVIIADRAIEIVQNGGKEIELH